eukprot:3038614-Rhodomonas_salina.1
MAVQQKPKTTSQYSSPLDQWKTNLRSVEVIVLRHSTKEDFGLLCFRRQAIQSKLVYKLKRDEFGIPVRGKALIVALGFQQELGVDFFESFSTMSHPVHVRAIMALAAEKHWHTNQIDIKTAYLQGELD